MKSFGQIGVSLAMTLLFGGAVVLARDWPDQARLFPWAIAMPMLVLASIQLLVDLRASHRSGSDPGLRDGIEPARARARTINIFFWIVGFLVLIWLLGFHLAVPVMVFSYLKVQSREGWVLSLLCTAIAWIFVWGVFDRFLALPFPEGVALQWWESLRSNGADG